MDMNAVLVDQQLQGLIQKHPEFFDQFGKKTELKVSSAFVLLCMMTSLDLPWDEAVECFTDGRDDLGIDGIHIGEERDNEFVITLFQAKYRTNLDGTDIFPETAVIKMIYTIHKLFDPSQPIFANPNLLARIEEARSMIRDGVYPVVHCQLCSNGRRWSAEAQTQIDNAGLAPDQVRFHHFNHHNIIAILRSEKQVDTVIQLEGSAFVENFNYKRVLIGKLPVLQISKLFEQYGSALLERNVRRYLGLHSNRVNAEISRTLRESSRRDNFYFFNNGITMICSQFRHNELQGRDFVVQLSGLQIINGGQTCQTICQTLKEDPDLAEQLSGVCVLLRLYELPQDSGEFVKDITYATNSQNPVDLRDLHANDVFQKNMELGLKELGITYRRKREDNSVSSASVTSAVLAEAVLAVWRQAPHQAKFMRKEHFGKLYHLIFNNLNAVQAFTAVLLFRYAENERKRSDRQTPEFLPYASHYIAMRLGVLLLKELGGQEISHRNWETVRALWEEKKEVFYKQAVEDIQTALREFYGERDLSLQQLSATFRRGDLIEKLK